MAKAGISIEENLGQYFSSEASGDSVKTLIEN